MLRQNAVDSQLIEQMKWTGEDVCTAFHVPPYKIGIGPPPNYNNIEALNQQYYSECLQVLIETIEILLDEGLGMSRNGEPQQLGTEFEIDDLLRMDTATRVASAKDAANGGGMTINEVRHKYHGLARVKGGDTVYLQQQNFGIEALAERDANQPFAKPTPPTPATPAPPLDPAAAKALMHSVFRERLRAA
jgi:phage portal protein BeeE